MSTNNKTNKSNNGKTTTNVVLPTYDEEFLKVFDRFWGEHDKNPDAYLLKWLRVNQPDHYEKIRSILNSKQTDWKKDVAVRKYLQTSQLIPKTVRKVKKATNGKSKAK